MKVLVIGAGGVGEAFARIAARSDTFSQICMADINLEKVRHVAVSVDSAKISAVQVDASSSQSVADLAVAFGADAILNACDPRFVESIFDAAFDARCIYVDMAMSLSKPHPVHPHELCGTMLGDYQFAKTQQWENRGLLALVGMGVEPGMSDVFAAFANKHLFSKIHEIGVRDGSNLVVEGYEFAPTFSIWTTIEECLNPPVIYQAGRGWYTTEPFSEPEIFDFPDGIGPLECVNVEHEEVILIPRYIEADRVTFKYGLGDEFIAVLKILSKLKLDSKEKITVGGCLVAPRDVVAALLPDPTALGPIMKGKTCAGTYVKGISKDGKDRAVYLYHVVDNESCVKEWGSQAVVWQTAINPVIALELIAAGIWVGKGVLGPEAFDPDPFLEGLIRHGTPYGLREDAV